MQINLSNVSSSFYREHNRKKTSIAVEIYKLDAKRLSAIYILALTQASEKKTENVELTCFIFHRTERKDAPVSLTGPSLVSSAAERPEPLGPVLRASAGELPA